MTAATITFCPPEPARNGSNDPQSRPPAGRPHQQPRQPRGSRPGRPGGSTGAETPIRGTGTHAGATLPQIKSAG